jgi:1-aminocyclopropane-1-carboxylate deaminase/D-cysteine desulfhydrase-like pyridoxal-dependent ACC family enzyme
MIELLDQIPPPDWIVFPSSSGGTHAGLALGAKISEYQGRVLGISIDEPESVLKDRVASLANEAAILLGEKPTLSAGEILVNAGYLGKGYGVMSELERDAIQLFARMEGILLDPVYTGRAAGALFDLLHEGYFQPNDRILFWHTGGSPALFAEQYCQILI